MEEQPRVEAYAKENARTTRVIYVIAGTDVETAAQTVKDRKITLDACVDSEGALSQHLNVEATPAVRVLNSSGKLVASYINIDEVPKGEGSYAGKLSPVCDSGQELGTAYDVVVLAINEEQAKVDLAAAREVCHALDRELSEWKETSKLSELNRIAGKQPYEASGDLLKIIKASLAVSKATKGAFDISWYPLGKLWERCAADGRVPSKDEIAETMKAVGYEKIRVEGSMVSFAHPDTKIGLGGVGKGWIVDKVFLELKSRGYENLIVRIGGDLRTAGHGPEGKWVFRITDPYDNTKIAGSFELADAAISTSGQYYRYHEISGKRYGHIFDPRTGLPCEFDGSVTVFAPDSAMADALAKALFVMGPEDGLKWVKENPGIQAIYVTRDGLKSSAN